MTWDLSLTLDAGHLVFASLPPIAMTRPWIVPPRGGQRCRPRGLSSKELGSLSDLLAVTCVDSTPRVVELEIVGHVV